MLLTFLGKYDNNKKEQSICTIYTESTNYTETIYLTKAGKFYQTIPAYLCVNGITYKLYL